MQVPFVDLEAQYRVIKTAIDKAWIGSFTGFRYIGGPRVTDFEDRFKKMLGAGHCVATSNGTSSLHLILRALGIGAGDEVITPAFSWISSAETVSLCHARPVFADVHPDTYTLDPDLIESHITPRTKAVIAVHLYGHAADVMRIRKICKKRRLFFIEDCAQAHLTLVNGQPVGTFGDASAFSFYPTKNLGAYGDAGCVVTRRAALAQHIRRLANHGALQKDDHLMEGLNSRMDVIQAAFLKAKLPYLKRWNSSRRAHAALYKRLLSQVEGVVLPTEMSGMTHTFHLFVIRAEKRDQLKKYLYKRHIQTLIHYPRALTNTPAYADMNLDRTLFPVANALEKEVLSLPIYPELTEAQIRYVSQNIKDFYKKVK
jgi:dTDP-4-amino-4,6-dideoxygalactose transaminase